MALHTESPSEPTVSTSHGRHFGSLDGLRAIALLAVLTHHFVLGLIPEGTALQDGVRYLFELGGLGVDLFFALSGFLITGILIDAKGTSPSRFFGNFYWRRSLRIFPAYYLLVVPLLLLLPSLSQGIGRGWFLLYLRNWRGSDPNSDNILGHLWSLAVEEQFYLVWPIVVFLCPTRHLPKVIIGLSLSALAFRWWMYDAGFGRYELIRFTFSRMDGLLLGGLVAYGWRFWPQKLISWAGVLACTGAIGHVSHFGPALWGSLQFPTFHRVFHMYSCAICGNCGLVPAFNQRLRGGQVS